MIYLNKAYVIALFLYLFCLSAFAEAPDKIENLKALADKENNVNAQTILGTMYLSGIGGVEIDDEKSLDYYLKAAKNGHVDSMVFASNLFMKNKNYDEAIKWSKEALFNGDTKAGLLVGSQYFIKAEPKNSDNKDLMLSFVWIMVAENLGEKIPEDIETEMKNYFADEQIKLIRKEAAIKTIAAKRLIKEKSNAKL